MDDFPAGPASLGPRRPPLTVVIPVRNGGLEFERCLRGLSASTWLDYELVVVDDGSTDDTAERARRHGARVIRHEQPLGPAASRNAGAEAASAPVIFFLDGDVVVHPRTLEQIVDRFERSAGLSALFGSYDDDPASPGVVSQFRNLLHHHVHQQGEFDDDARPAHTFWTGCGAIRREVFLDVGGFDPRLYRRPAIEDIELGYRLTRAGHRIELVRSIQATHLKRWTLGLMVKTDVFHRGVPWMLLLMRSKRKETDLNVSHGQRLCVLATALVWLALPGLLLAPGAAALAVAGSVGLIAAINRAFYRFLAGRRGLFFAIRCLPLHLVYYTCCGASVGLAMALRLLLIHQPEQARADSRWRPVDVPSFPRPRVLSRRPSRWNAR